MKIVIEVWMQGGETQARMLRGDTDLGARKLNANASRHLLSLADFLERPLPRRRKNYGPYTGPKLKKTERWAIVAELCEMGAIEHGGPGRCTTKELAKAAGIGERRAESYLQVAASRGHLRRLGDGVFELVPVAAGAAE